MCMLWGVEGRLGCGWVVECRAGVVCEKVGGMRMQMLRLVLVVVVVIELSRDEVRLFDERVDSSSLGSRRLYLVLLYSAHHFETFPSELLDLSLASFFLAAH